MNNRKIAIKIVIAALLILAVPIIFFQFLGGSLLEMNGPKKRVIAIVNEDLGDAKDQETIEMGKDVISILADESPYEWKAMGRSSAVKGLKANQYEAIVYIPSDFSENIMSYEEDNPMKAEFNFQVQRQKNGANKEKVLHEIEAATSRVNQKVSTLYWSYIASEIDYIKKEFATILDKETEFLTAMSSYYKPGSAELAEEMLKQKEQVEGLRLTMGEANQDHDDRIQNVNSFSQQFSAFISYVDNYKGFQEQQKNILMQIQGDSLEKIQTTAVKQVKKYNESVNALEKNTDKVNDEIKKVNEKVDENNEKFNQLSELRKEQVNRQMDDLVVVQGEAIDRYNTTILKKLEQQIKTDKKNPMVASESIAGLPSKEDLLTKSKEIKDKAAIKSNRDSTSLLEEKEKSKEILNALATIKDNLQKTDPESILINEFSQLETELMSFAAELAKKEELLTIREQGDVTDLSAASSAYSDLTGYYNNLDSEYKSVKQILDSYPADTAKLFMEIKEKEKSLLEHNGLTEGKKAQLSKLFDSGSIKSDIKSLLAYFATLQQFGLTLDEQGNGTNKDKVLEDEIFKALLKSVVEIGEEEQVGWNLLEQDLPETQLGLVELNSTFAAIMSGFEESIEEQHTALTKDLVSITDQGNILLTQVQTPSTFITSGEPIQSVNEGEVMSGQENVGSQLITLSGLMNSMSQRQDGIVTYAKDLHGKANDIKETSSTFSNKWDTNVDAMGNFNDDIKSFLSNTYIDGQENGYVFNHLVNPLQFKGEASTLDELKKIPPVILFIILLISSLLIGFFSYRIPGGTFKLRLGLLAMLAIVTGLLISLYSVNMYILRDNRAIEWTIFTILLLLAGASFIWLALGYGQTSGWIASLILMCVYITPLLILGVPELTIPDLLSKVYMSFKYEPETLFGWGTAIIITFITIVLILSFFQNRKTESKTSSVDETYES